MKNYLKCICILASVILWGWSVRSHAAGFVSFGETEKPAPEFQRSGPTIMAKLIPRAKSTRVTILFGVAGGGSLEGVKGVDFESVAHADVDIKNFKSAVFEIRISQVKSGETALLSIKSDFFTKSTMFYVCNPAREKPWVDTKAENRADTDRVRELIIPVQDGGDFDADGRIDGRVTVIGGPRDSFWGYALGTLFIRFFGIFIVLSILMIGMFLSGVIFNTLEQRRKRTAGAHYEMIKTEMANKSDIVPVESDADRSSDVSEETAAAIGIALHLHLSNLRMPGETHEAVRPQSPWASEGRQRMMNERLSVFNRFN